MSFRINGYLSESCCFTKEPCQFGRLIRDGGGFVAHGAVFVCQKWLFAVQRSSIIPRGLPSVDRVTKKAIDTTWSVEVYSEMPVRLVFFRVDSSFRQHCIIRSCLLESRFSIRKTWFVWILWQYGLGEFAFRAIGNYMKCLCERIPGFSFDEA